LRKTVSKKGALLLLPGILWLLSAAPVLAEPQKLALPQVIEIAMENNGNLKSFREEKGLRDAGKVRAGLLPNPTLDFDAGAGALTGSSNENSLLLGVSQEFFLGGKREQRLASAELELEMYRWQLADKERTLREEVNRAFYDVILSKERITLADRAIALNRQLLDVAQERLAAGDIPELEMNLVKVELATSEAARIDVEKALDQNQARLAALMGLPPGESPPIVGVLATEIHAPRNPTELKQLARGNRPDLKALAAEKTRGESDITLARSEAIPNLTAGLALRRDTTTMEIGGVEGKETAYSIGLRLSMPIPLFDKNQAGVQEATAKRNSTESRLTAAARDAEREIETAYASLLHAGKILSLYRSNIIPQLEENLQLTQEAYRLGEVGILAVIQEQKKFFEVSDGYLTSLHDRQSAFVKLEAAVSTDISGGVQ
jgi:cobalt-zinc-cadmium efflux system outer membrane protein